MKISHILKHAILSTVVFAVASCTNSGSDTATESPFEDIEWPTSFVPVGVEGDTVLLLGDGSTGAGLYPEVYFDTGPTHVRFTFGGTAEGGLALIEGLPIHQNDPPPTVEEIWADDNRSITIAWTPPTSAGSVLSGIEFFFSLIPVDDDGDEIENVSLRPYSFENISMQFESVQTDGVENTYRGKFLSGTFSMGVGPAYGDTALVVDGNDTVITYVLSGNPFVFTTPVPVEPVPPVDPPVDPDPAP